MAEFVEYRKECALPEYEQMQLLNLFTHEEILKMKKARENFEYRVTQPSREIRDFVEYIKYERSIIVLTKQRTKVKRPNENHTICTLIANRMKQLYAQALSKFPHNIRFWDEYVKFLQQLKFAKDIPATFDRMLQFHSNKADVWIRAILWEYNENFNEERVKGLLLRAQQHHPDNQKLYLTFFQIELENKRQADDELALQHANVVYNNGKQKFTDIAFYIEMLKIVDMFEFAVSIQQRILSDLRETFRHDELMWHTFAQRELNGQPTANFIQWIRNDGDAVNKFDTVKSEDTLFVTRKRIDLCVKVYDEAVLELDTAKMWTYYLDAIIELNKDSSYLPAFKRYTLTRAFESAKNSDYMTEQHYLQYIELLYSNNPKDEKIEEILQKATQIYSNSENIWLLYVRYCIQQNDFKKIKEVFAAVKARLGAKGADIWQFYLLYLKSCRNLEANAELERFITDVACQLYPNFNHLKAHILEIISTTMGMKRARKTYDLFIKHYPNCYEVHEMMADIEAKQMTRDVNSERHCLEMMILNFGKVRTDVWLRYMRFENNVGNPINLSRLHQNALATLNPELLDDFSAQYNFFSNRNI